MSLLSCPSCLRQTIHNLTVDSTAYSSSLLSYRLSQRKELVRIVSTRNKTTRHHATYDSLVKGHHRRILRKTLSKKILPPPNNRRKSAGSLTKGEIKDALARDNNRARLLGNDVSDTGVAISNDERKQQIRLKKDIEQYYTDPLQLANAVIAKLRIPDLSAAVAMVRASEGIVTNNAVSWNHCIDWCMSQGETDKAWKLYNELKKRGHKPDAYTYTIMLRGLSQNARKGGNAERAVGIYNSMFAPNSSVTPNAIHTNAVLNVCARTRDMESLWLIAGQLPEQGPGAPDRVTYTTILNAIREDAASKVAAILKNPMKESREYTEMGGEGLDTEDLKKSQLVIFDEALKDGRKLWQQISYRWRRANLVIDEQLVCAMGRLILSCAPRKDFGEVLDLVDSTMNIRLAERGHKKGSQAEVNSFVQTAEFGDGDLSIETATVEKAERTFGATPEFPALVKGGDRSLPFAEEQMYAKPGNDTLSLILTAATGEKQMQLGRSYWHYLTTSNGPYSISPDANNIISYLRLLRVSRASTDALAVLSREWAQDVAEKLYRRGTFVIAMSTCIRDKNNPHVFDTADKLLTLMRNKLEEAQVGLYDKIDATENDATLGYKERRAAAKARAAGVDDITFGEGEAQSELQRTKHGVESSIVDPKALRMYIDLAVLKTSGWNEGLRGKEGADEKFERDAKKNPALKALRRVNADMVNIHRLAKSKLLEAEIEAHSGGRANETRTSQKKTADRAGTRVAENLEDMMALLQGLVSAYDKVIYINERFEDQNRPQLDRNMIDDFRANKRKISGFLSRTKDEVKRITRGDLKFSRWRDMQGQKEHDEEVSDDDGDVDEVPAMGKEIQRIYQDTDRELGRARNYSRRQKFERQTAVERRMVKRLGVGRDPGVLDEELHVGKKEEVEERMRRRAFGINVGRETTYGGMRKEASI